MSDLHIKLYNYSARGVLKEIRRVNAPQVAWKEVQGLPMKLGGGAPCRLEYEDNEGDRIVLETEQEWEECLRAGPYGVANPLRLHATKKKPTKEGKDMQDAKDDKDGQDTAMAPQVISPDAAGGPEVKEAMWPIIHRHLLIGPGNAVGPDWLKAALRFDPVPNGAPSDVDVDINVDAFAACLAARALQLMEGPTVDYPRALCLLQDAHALKPTSHGLYNTGCCLALLGCPEEALAALEGAVGLGYRNAEHLATDPDLASLHDSPRFRALLQHLNPCVSPSQSSTLVLAAQMATDPQEPVLMDTAEALHIVPTPSDDVPATPAEHTSTAPVAPVTSDAAAPETHYAAYVEATWEIVPAEGPPPAPAADEPVAEGPGQLADQHPQLLYKLHELGFLEDEANVAALTHSGWTLPGAVDWLLSQAALQ